ncbi:MAG: hypothetical protein AAFU80_09415 [Pseudomonadota bacterium]
MIVYQHRFQGVLQQMVNELGLDVILADENSPVSLSDNEAMFTEVAQGLNIEVKKMAAKNGSILYKFQKRS